MKTSRLKVMMVFTFLTLVIVLNINSYQIAKTNMDMETKVSASDQILKGNDEINNSTEDNTNIEVVEDVVDVPDEEEVEAEEPIVYDGMTLTQLSEKLERSMNSSLSGQGYNFASYCISLGMDPYLALAIVLEETGCTWNCSYLVTACNNIGGQKGSGCGDYAAYESLDVGMRAFIDNIYYNYYALGLTNPYLMNSKYAENPAWGANVSAYVERIKNA